MPRTAVRMKCAHNSCISEQVHDVLLGAVLLGFYWYTRRTIAWVDVGRPAPMPVSPT